MWYMRVTCAFESIAAWENVWDGWACLHWPSSAATFSSASHTLGVDTLLLFVCLICLMAKMKMRCSFELCGLQMWLIVRFRGAGPTPSSTNMVGNKCYQLLSHHQSWAAAHLKLLVTNRTRVTERSMNSWESQACQFWLRFLLMPC